MVIGIGPERVTGIGSGTGDRDQIGISDRLHRNHQDDDFARRGVKSEELMFGF